MEETPKEIPVTITAIEKDGVDQVPTTPMYVNREKLIQKYWIEKKMEKVKEGITPAEFDELLKSKLIAEARKLYPKRGMYKVEKGIITFLGNI